MSLYKVTDIVSRFLAEGWIGLSHHCRSSDRLQIKTESHEYVSMPRTLEELEPIK